VTEATVRTMPVGYAGGTFFARELDMFDGFDAPTQPVNLVRGELSAEVWPELGGAIASFLVRPPRSS
jgi:hypothetical protein